MRITICVYRYITSFYLCSRENFDLQKFKKLKICLGLI
jgi:hypothetical protein